MMLTMMWKWEGKLMRGGFNGECPLEECLGMIMGMRTMLLVDILMTIMEDSMGMADTVDMMEGTVDMGEDTMADMMDTMGMAGTLMDTGVTVVGTMTDTEGDTEEVMAEDTVVMAEDLEAMGFTRDLEKLVRPKAMSASV